jgi:hypothetical protein
MTDILETFFKNWLQATSKRKKDITQFWNYESELSSVIMYDSNSVLGDLSAKMELNYKCEYYKLDAVFYHSDDKVSYAPSGQTWLSTIQIAFEHENYINSGLFQETSHLMITDCNLAVLVTYPNNELEISREIKLLHELIQKSLAQKKTITEKKFLLIFGWLQNEDLLWFGCRFQNDDWQLLDQSKLDLQQKTSISTATFSIRH